MTAATFKIIKTEFVKGKAYESLEKLPDNILQNINFSRRYKNRNKFIGDFDPNIIKLKYISFLQKKFVN